MKSREDHSQGRGVSRKKSEKPGDPAVEKQRENNGKHLGGITGKGFLPGQSGNPGGRPKGSIKISTAFQHSLARLVPGDAEGRSYAQKIADTIVELAASGDVRAIKEVADRTEGRPTQMMIEKRDGITLEELHELMDRFNNRREGKMSKEEEDWFES
jgi:hypothetical protein